MSKHNLERRRLWQLGLSRKQLGRKLSGAELQTAIAVKIKMLQSERRP